MPYDKLLSYPFEDFDQYDDTKTTPFDTTFKTGHYRTLRIESAECLTTEYIDFLTSQAPGPPPVVPFQKVKVCVPIRNKAVELGESFSESKISQNLKKNKKKKWPFKVPFKPRNIPNKAESQAKADEITITIELPVDEENRPKGTWSEEEMAYLRNQPLRRKHAN